MNDEKPTYFINAQVMRCIICYNEVSLLNTQDARNVYLFISKKMTLWSWKNICMLNIPCLHINNLKRSITTQKIHMSNEFLNRGLESLQTSFMISSGCWSIWKWQWIKISISSKSSYLHHKKLFTNSNYRKPLVAMDGALIISLVYFPFQKVSRSLLVWYKDQVFVCVTSFVWMFVYHNFQSLDANDVFALVVNFINLDWQPKQITIGSNNGIET